MELSHRLSVIAEAVSPGNRVADIGTDHGYVPIYLVKKGICPSAIAADINQGPIDRARVNIEREHLSDRIVTRLSDGLSSLEPEECDTVVIAGMGGELICRILTEGSRFLKAGCELVLSPQSELFKVRHMLHKNNYRIAAEHFLKEDGKYYTVMRCVPGEESYETETEYEYGKLLIEEKNPTFLEYLEKQLIKTDHILQKMSASANVREGKTARRYQELAETRRTILEITDKNRG